jgi:hypothetical protein
VQSSKKKKKKSKAAVGLSDVLTPQAGGASASSAAGTPAGKRKAAKAADDGMDEVDRALAELKLQFPGLDEEQRARASGSSGSDDKPAGGLALGLRCVLGRRLCRLRPQERLTRADLFAPSGTYSRSTRAAWIRTPSSAASLAPR